VARPQLRPGLRRLWRDSSTLQLGLSPAHGAVVAGLRAGDDVVLAALDGRHDLRDLHALARANSVPASRVNELIRLLGQAGVLVRAGSDRACLSRVTPDARRRLGPDAASWALVYDGVAHPDAVLARRAMAHVRVDGLGRLGTAVAATLATAGVGRVDGEDRRPVRPDDVLAAGHGADDVGRPRAASLARAIERVLGRQTEHAEHLAAPLPESPAGQTARPQDDHPGDNGVAQPTHRLTDASPGHVGGRPTPAPSRPPAGTSGDQPTEQPAGPQPAVPPGQQAGQPQPGLRTPATRRRARSRPDLVVVVRDDAVELAVADELVHRGIAHLAVVTGADRVVVGPLVLPGRGPCLRCVHLHRCDRDPAWPQLAAQLTAGTAGAAGTAATGSGAEVASATAAAGLVALQVLTHLDGIRPPVSLGRTLDLVLPDGLVERRRWAPHPRCGCTRLPGVPHGPPHPSTASSARDGIA
jgi:hypothetical protein